MDLKGVIPEECQCVADLLGRNTIAARIGLMEGGEKVWATGALTRWTKPNSDSCFFTSILYEGVVFRRLIGSIFMLHPKLTLLLYSPFLPQDSPIYPCSAL
ncbi:hypothetical protein EVAR_2641_1 [Eumeta japonica]|uniref:Uncharacterized protein n=1 Tax=Eumeta variegata TaxID=151549 RepID=A0A4C1SMI8_EUMVA|nr:hypothetical protein EVAR_2641_1 [Eumeta japonica]